MSIKDMITDIERDTRQEIEVSKNRAKAESTKILMDKAEYWENSYRDKKEKLELQLQGKERSLRAEKDFTYRNMALVSEDLFAQSLIPFIKEVLLSFPLKHHKEYQKLLSSWLEKALQSLNSPQFILRLNPRDKDLALNYKNISVQEDPSLEAGFILSTGSGVHIDLSFQSLFTENQTRLQNKAVRFLKESSQ